jgi:hypothetical protein
MTTFSFLMALKFIGIALAAIAILGFVVLKLWNWLVPELFKGPKIRFKHALGLMALSFILFGGLHGGRHWGGRHYGMYHNNCQKEQNCMPQQNNNTEKNTN